MFTKSLVHFQLHCRDHLGAARLQEKSHLVGNRGATVSSDNPILERIVRPIWRVLCIIRHEIRENPNSII